MSNFTNSPLVSYTKLSPNHSGQRKQKIDTITIHCLVGHLSLKTIGELFAKESNNGSSCQYAVDDYGNVGMYCEEKNRSWCTSSSVNDQRSITIEVVCDKTHPYKVTDAALKGLIALCADICKRNDIKKLLWKGDKKLAGQIDKQNMTVHRWFANKACPGDYLYGKHYFIANEVNKLLAAKEEKVVTKKPWINDLEPYLVKVTATSLKVRKGPGTDHATVTLIKKDEVYTIVEESKGTGASKWGKLKSGAGWVSLDWCEKRR